MGGWAMCKMHVARSHSQGIIARPGVDSVCWIYIVCIQQLLLANIENLLIRSYSYINEHGSHVGVYKMDLKTTFVHKPCRTHTHQV